MRPLTIKSMSAAQNMPMGPLAGPAHSLYPAVFLHAKKAGAHKSSPAKIGKAAGCSCEEIVSHTGSLTLNG